MYMNQPVQIEEACVDKIGNSVSGGREDDLTNETAIAG